MQTRAQGVKVRLFNLHRAAIRFTGSFLTQLPDGRAHFIQAGWNNFMWISFSCEVIL